MEILTPVKAIRAKCMDCCCGQKLEVRLCPNEKCALWPYRMGHRPKGNKGIAPEDSPEKVDVADDFGEETDESP